MHLLVSNFVSVEKFDIYILGDCTFNSRRPELYTISFFCFLLFFSLTFIFWNSKTQPKPLSSWLKQLNSCQTHKNKNWLQNLVCVFVVLQRTRKKKLQSKNEILKWNIFNEFDVLADNERMENKIHELKNFFLIRFNQTNEKLCETK